MTVTELMIRENLGPELRKLRERRGLSLREMAAKLPDGDLTAQAISRIELNERAPRATTLVALAKALDVEFVASPDGLSVVERE